MYPPSKTIRGVGKGIEFLAEGVGVETTPEGLGFSGKVPFYESAKKGIAAIADDPMGVLGTVGQAVSGMIEEQMQASAIRPGEMVRDEDGTLRQATSDELASTLDPTLGGSLAAPLIKRGAMGGLEGLMPQPGVLTAGGAPTRKEYGVKLYGAEDPDFENKVVELPVRFETDTPALQNMSVSYVEPTGRQKGGEIVKYRNQDMPAPEDEIGIVRLTAPTEDLATVPKNDFVDQAWKGPIHEGHMPMFVGGDKGFSEGEVARLRVKMQELMDDGVAEFRRDYGSDPDEEALKMIMAESREAARRSPQYQDLKNAPVGFARFVDTRILDKDGVPLSGDKEYMRTTEIQSDLFAEARGDYIGEKVPETYEGITKNDKPLTGSIVKGLVVTAKDRGKKGVVLPSSQTSEAGVRYSSSNLKKLTKKVTDDLGEGYSVRKVYVENRPIKIMEPDSVKIRSEVPKMSEHVVIEWDSPDMPDQIKFAEGGIVNLEPRPASRGIEDVIRKYRREGMMD